MTKTEIHVGGLSQDVRECDLDRFFRKYGRIQRISLNDGFAYVKFADQRDAADAVFELDGKTLLGRAVSLKRASETDQVERRNNYSNRISRQNKAHEQYRVIIENLSTRVQWQELKDIMSRFGEVDFAKAHNIRANEGMVQFTNHYSMRRAIENMDRTELYGRRIRLSLKEHESRQRSSNYNHRPREHYRSRSPIRTRRPEWHNSNKRSNQERRRIKDNNFRSVSRTKPDMQDIKLEEKASKSKLEDEVSKPKLEEEALKPKIEEEVLRPKLEDASKPKPEEAAQKEPESSTGESLEELPLLEEFQDITESWSNFKRHNKDASETEPLPSN